MKIYVLLKVTLTIIDSSQKKIQCACAAEINNKLNMIVVYVLLNFFLREEEEKEDETVINGLINNE